MNNQEMVAGNIPIETLEKLVKEIINMNPLVFYRLAQI